MDTFIIMKYKTLSEFLLVASSAFIVALVIVVSNNENNTTTTTTSQYNFVPISHIDKNNITNAQLNNNPLYNKRVVLLGDSQAAGAPGRVLENFLVAEGVTYFYRAGQPGWGVRRWLSQRYRIRNMLITQRPNVVIIMLGGNDWSRAGSRNYPMVVREFWNFINSNISNENVEAVCWVGPPRIVGSRAAEIQPKREIVSMTIEDIIGEEHFINSSDITGEFGRTADGLHFTYAGARRWITILNNRIKGCIEGQTAQ